jgi:2-oxo-4-hydroxy-4-carboxy-5-ureidoimidazoline decarboxylase
MPDLKAVNSWPADKAKEEFLRCCGSRRWAERVTAERPFASDSDLFTSASQIWFALEPAHWMEAFAAHPRIGGKDALREKFAKTADWAKGEQSRVSQASEETLEALAAGNEAYEKKFGHIFIICATGKSADEMLEALRLRLPHDALTELRLAAVEQDKITAIRLQKLLNSP